MSLTRQRYIVLKSPLKKHVRTRNGIIDFFMEKREKRQGLKANKFDIFI